MIMRALFIKRRRRKKMIIPRNNKVISRRRLIFRDLEKSFERTNEDKSIWEEQKRTVFEFQKRVFQVEKTSSLFR